MSHVRDFDDLPLWSGGTSATPATFDAPRYSVAAAEPSPTLPPSREEGAFGRSECGGTGTEGCITYEWR